MDDPIYCPICGRAIRDGGHEVNLAKFGTQVVCCDCAMVVDMRPRAVSSCYDYGCDMEDADAIFFIRPGDAEPLWVTGDGEMKRDGKRWKAIMAALQAVCRYLNTGYGVAE